MKESIRKLGRGLTVLVTCEATGADNFLAFSAWYSLTKNLPDAKVVLACRRPRVPVMDVFPWAYRVGVPFFYHSKSDATENMGGPVFVIPADTVCLEPLGGAVLDAVNSGERVVDGGVFCLPAKNQDPVTFCSLRGGCGTFVPSEWIDKGGHPFRRADLYGKGDLTVNEKRVFSVWKKLCPLYDNIV